MAIIKGDGFFNTLTGSPENDSILGFGGDDTLFGLAGNDLLDGGAGNDDLDGGTGNDNLVGGAGHDVLDGGPGRDRMVGGGGNDIYFVDNRGDQIVESTGVISNHDMVNSSVSYTLSSNAENLMLTGTRDLSGTGNTMSNFIGGTHGNNKLYGMAGDDTIAGDGTTPLAGSGRGGNDRLYGGIGADDLVGDISESLYENTRGGDDLLYGGAGNDFNLIGDSYGMFGDSRGGNDRLYGGAGDDTMYGDAGSMASFLTESVRGGNDRLYGGAGDDRLYGDAFTISGTAKGGDDRLYGGSGRDTFGFGGWAAIGDERFGDEEGSFGTDIIFDFRQGEDRLEFDWFEAVQSIDDLQIGRQGCNTVISVLDYGTIKLIGFTGTLTAGDLVFVAAAGSAAQLPDEGAAEPIGTAGMNLATDLMFA